MESRLHCIDICDNDIINHVFFVSSTAERKTHATTRIRTSSETKTVNSSNKGTESLKRLYDSYIRAI